MKIYINQKETEIFAGACVKDAVLAYDITAWQLLLKGKLAAHDRYGNIVEPDGALSAGQSLTLNPKHSI
jgi:hypothetical protein